MWGGKTVVTPLDKSFEYLSKIVICIVINYLEFVGFKNTSDMGHRKVEVT